MKQEQPVQRVKKVIQVHLESQELLEIREQPVLLEIQEQRAQQVLLVILDLLALLVKKVILVILVH